MLLTCDIETGRNRANPQCFAILKHATFNYSFFFVDGVPEIDITFAITKSAARPNTVKLMPDIIKSIVYRYGIKRVRTSIIVFGDKPIRVFDFGYDFPNIKVLLDRIDNLPNKETANPDILKSLEETKKLFEDAPTRKNARLVLVTIMDRSSNVPEDKIKSSVRDLQNKGIMQIAVVIGSEIPREQTDSLTIFRNNVIKTTADTPSWNTGEEIITRIIGCEYNHTCWCSIYKRCCEVWKSIFKQPIFLF